MSFYELPDIVRSYGLEDSRTNWFYYGVIIRNFMVSRLGLGLEMSENRFFDILLLVLVSVCLEHITSLFRNCDEVLFH